MIASGLSFYDVRKLASARVVFGLFCWLAFFSVLSPTVHAETNRINLIADACVARGGGVNQAAVQSDGHYAPGLSYECGARLRSGGDAQIWVRLPLANHFQSRFHQSRFQESDAQRFLVINTLRFSELQLLAPDENGGFQLNRYTPDIVRNAWVYGNGLKLSLPVMPDNGYIYLGISNMPVGDALLRAELMSDRAIMALSHQWLIVSGICLGALVASLVYTLILLSGVRHRLHFIYVGWMAAAIVYGLIWSGLAYHLVPGLTAEGINRSIYLSGIAAVALNIFFFTGFFADGQIPSRLSKTLKIFGFVLLALCGLVVVKQPHIQLAGNVILSIVIIVVQSLTFIGICHAVRREPGPGMLYAVGWSFLALSVAMMLARFYGFFKTSSLLDYSVFFATITHALLISAATAIRTTHKREQWMKSLQEREYLRQLAETDGLTTMLNRRGFIARAQPFIARQSGASLIIMDVDRFKDVNDSFGHDIGDKVLARLGRTITSQCQYGNGIAPVAAGRIGGEEFAILLDICSENDALTFADRIRRRLAGMDWSDLLGTGRGVTISIGVASVPAGFPASFERLYVAADHALYAAKHKGRNRAEIATIEDIRRANARLATVN